MTWSLPARQVRSTATFTVGGLDWAVRYYPDGDIYPRCWRQLGAVGPRGCLRRASDLGRRVLGARVGFGLVDQTTGKTLSLFREKDPILLDAISEDTCTWGTGEVARRSYLHAGSRYVIGDRLKIECSIDVCDDFLTFEDPPPTSSSGLLLFQQVGYGKGEPDVIIQVEGGMIGAHYCILNAHCTKKQILTS
ncbi:Speckle-type POZ protein-like protein [Hordeum vulgare]|nr:Speckle-type POZ protein-like protein [Hordeum vulgare]